MVEINLEAIALADSPEYTKFDVINIPFLGVLDKRKTAHGTSKAYFDNLESQYGIMFKYVWGYNKDNQYTQAYITNWDDTYLYFFIWSNQPPSFGSFIKLTLVAPISYIGASATQTIAVGENLINGSLSIKQQFESLKKMDLRASFAMFDLVSSIDLDAFMGKYWTTGTYGGKYHAIGVQIKVDNVAKFWGYLKPENIIYDPEFRVYSIEAFDWVKFLLDTKGQNPLPDYSSPNLSRFLTDNMFVFNNLTIDVGTINQNWIEEDYNYIRETNSDGNTILVSIEHLMTVEDMIVECIKHYNAYLYYDGDKNLIFKNRSSYNIPTDHAIDNAIISETLSKIYIIRDYDSLLINVEGTWKGLNGVDGEYSGWVLLWMESGELKSLPINADLENIPIGKKYLDLRQLIPYASFDHRLFDSRDRNEVYNDYAYLLVDSIRYNAEVVRTDLQIGDLISYNGSDFIIRDVEIIPSEGKSVLIMEQKIGN